MRISDWSSDVCSSDLQIAQSRQARQRFRSRALGEAKASHFGEAPADQRGTGVLSKPGAFDHAATNGEHVLHRPPDRSEEHTSELQSLMRISYAVFCLKKKKKTDYTKIYAT